MSVFGLPSRLEVLLSPLLWRDGELAGWLDLPAADAERIQAGSCPQFLDGPLLKGRSM